MTFDEFWKQSGWHSENAELYEGTAEYNLAQDAWDAALKSAASQVEQKALLSFGQRERALKEVVVMLRLAMLKSSAQRGR